MCRPCSVRSAVSDVQAAFTREWLAHPRNYLCHPAFASGHTFLGWMLKVLYPIVVWLFKSYYVMYTATLLLMDLCAFSIMKTCLTIVFFRRTCCHRLRRMLTDACGLLKTGMSTKDLQNKSTLKRARYAGVPIILTCHSPLLSSRSSPKVMNVCELKTIASSNLFFSMGFWKEITSESMKG